MQKNTQPSIGIVGVGWVGSQLKRYFEEKGYTIGENLLLYDLNPAKSAGNIKDADIIFICVPTPPSAKDGSCDISYVEDAVSQISGEKIIVIRSTVSPGTTETLQQKHPQHKFLFNPEFLTESRAWEDMIRPDRQIVGFTAKSLDAAHTVLALLPQAPFMSPWGQGTYEAIRINATQAEMIKYATNNFFAMKVVYANALADLCNSLSIEYDGVKRGLAADHRIGGSHIDVYHGGYRGFGGYCLPKDLSALLAFAKTKSQKQIVSLLQAIWDFNETLLFSQGLTVAKVSKHTNEVQKMLEGATHGNVRKS